MVTFLVEVIIIQNNHEINKKVKFNCRELQCYHTAVNHLCNTRLLCKYPHSEWKLQLYRWLYRYVCVIVCMLSLDICHKMTYKYENTSHTAATSYTVYATNSANVMEVSQHTLVLESLCSGQTTHQSPFLQRHPYWLQNINQNSVNNKYCQQQIINVQF